VALNKRERILVGVTVAVVVLGGTYLLFTPLRTRSKKLGDEIGNQRRTLEAMKATLERAPEWQKQYEDLQKKVGRQGPQFEQGSDVLKKIEEMGTIAGIVIINRRQLPSVEKDVLRELPVQCSFEATTESLVKFLHGLQSSSGFMCVDQLQVAPKPDNSGILRCDIQIRALSGRAEKTSS